MVTPSFVIEVPVSVSVPGVKVTSVVALSARLGAALGDTGSFVPPQV